MSAVVLLKEVCTVEQEKRACLAAAPVLDILGEPALFENEGALNQEDIVDVPAAGERAAADFLRQT